MRQFADVSKENIVCIFMDERNEQEETSHGGSMFPKRL
jgi:hypothetical protein